MLEEHITTFNNLELIHGQYNKNNQNFKDALKQHKYKTEKEYKQEFT
jgi:hypothetical protein